MMWHRCSDPARLEETWKKTTRKNFGWNISNIYFADERCVRKQIEFLRKKMVITPESIKFVLYSITHRYKRWLQYYYCCHTVSSIHNLFHSLQKKVILIIGICRIYIYRVMFFFRYKLGSHYLNECGSLSFSKIWRWHVDERLRVFHHIYDI